MVNGEQFCLWVEGVISQCRCCASKHVDVVCQCVGTSEVGCGRGCAEGMFACVLCLLVALDFGAALVSVLWHKDVKPVFVPITPESDNASAWQFCM